MEVGREGGSGRQSVCFQFELGVTLGTDQCRYCYRNARDYSQNVKGKH